MLTGTLIAWGIGAVCYLFLTFIGRPRVGCFVGMGIAQICTNVLNGKMLLSLEHAPGFPWEYTIFMVVVQGLVSAGVLLLVLVWISQTEEMQRHMDDLESKRKDRRFQRARMWRAGRTLDGAEHSTAHSGHRVSRLGIDREIL